MIKFDYLNFSFHQKSLPIKTLSPAFCSDSGSIRKLKKEPIFELYQLKFIFLFAIQKLELKLVNGPKYKPVQRVLVYSLHMTQILINNTLNCTFTCPSHLTLHFNTSMANSQY